MLTSFILQKMSPMMQSNPMPNIITDTSKQGGSWQENQEVVKHDVQETQAQ